MSRQLLSYWKPDTADANLQRGGPLDHAASNQYGSVGIGDTVWIVTVRGGELYLLGRILVGQVTDTAGAARVLQTSDLWDANHHILSERGTSLTIQQIPIAHIAADLRFESRNGNDRLAISKGMVNPQQLQRTRVLTAATATLLHDAFKAGTTPTTVGVISPNVTRESSEVRRDVEKPQDDRRAVLESLRRLQAAGRKSLDLVKPAYRDLDRSEVDLNGLCYVLSECLYHLHPGLLTPYRISWGDGTTHWFLRYSNGEILDAIAEAGHECCAKENYGRARRRPFFTKNPSKRAIKLLTRAGFRNPTKR